MERVSIHNIVVRFFSSQETAEKAASVLGLKVFKHAGTNQFVYSSDITAEHPEIFDTTSLIFTKRTQASDLNARLWMGEFVKELEPV